MPKRRVKKAAPVRDQYDQWKLRIRTFYDWITNHTLDRPPVCCRWGPLVAWDIPTECQNIQRLYLSHKADDSAPNTLVVTDCEVFKKTAYGDQMAELTEEERSPYVMHCKTIIPPAEVKRIREFPHNPNIVATLTDSSDVLIWGIKAQPDREVVFGAVHSSPLLALRGHEDKAELALAVSSELFVLSGGTGKNVLLWNIEDHISTLKLTGDRSISSRQIFKGHTDTVEDVQFRRSSPQEFCSVGDDSCLILWDARDWNPAAKVEKAHGAAIRSVDWNRCDENYIITGSADKLVRLFDRRMVIKDGVGSPVNTFEDHTAAVLCVQWCPDKSSLFGSSSEDGILNVWDHKMVRTTHAERPHLYLRHAGHRGGKVVDFHWNQSDPWTIAGISDDFGSGSGGAGKLQIWRLTGWLYDRYAVPDPEPQERADSCVCEV